MYDFNQRSMNHMELTGNNIKDWIKKPSSFLFKKSFSFHSALSGYWLNLSSFRVCLPNTCQIKTENFNKIIFDPKHNKYTYKTMILTKSPIKSLNYKVKGDFKKTQFSIT